jgi:hypothetical protein
MRKGFSSKPNNLILLNSSVISKTHLCEGKVEALSDNVDVLGLKINFLNSEIKIL